MRYREAGRPSPATDHYGLRGHSRAPGTSFYHPNFEVSEIPAAPGSVSVYLFHGRPKRWSVPS